jgi:hypothetical protein
MHGAFVAACSLLFSTGIEELRAREGE